MTVRLDASGSSPNTSPTKAPKRAAAIGAASSSTPQLSLSTASSLAARVGGTCEATSGLPAPAVIVKLAEGCEHDHRR